MGSKRRRLALSCVACRRRKVKCDRTFPTCVRCQKGEVSCDYISYTGPKRPTEALPTPSDENANRQREASVASWTEEADIWHSSSVQNAHQLLSQEAHVQDASSAAQAHPPAMLQAQTPLMAPDLNVRAPRLPPASSEPLQAKILGKWFPQLVASESRLPDHERASLRGKGFKTKYHGPSHAANILLQTEQLSKFAKETLSRVPVLEASRSFWKAQRHSENPTLNVVNFQVLLESLPNQKRCDALVQEYFSTIETTYRVLHTPTFSQRYKDFWQSPENSSAAFLAQLLLVCASVNSNVSGGPSGFISRSSLTHSHSTKWIELCEGWLDQQSQKHVTLEAVQVQVLLLITKRLNFIKHKREWTMAGHVLRLAMSSGLHREPSFLNTTISVFDQEMRRRLWHTILEIEIQASLDRGMPPGVQPYDWDCLPPSNIHDEDFDQNIDKLPAARPLTEFTRTSFLCMAERTLPLRLEILSRVNSIRFGLDSDTAIEYDQRIRDALGQLPSWKENESGSIAHDLSDLILYEYLLLIHQPFTMQPVTQSRHFYSRVARRDAAMVILKIFTDMSLGRALTFGNLREGLFRACIAVCHSFCTFSSSTQPRNEPLMQAGGPAIELVEKAVDIIESRIRHLGQGFHEFWLSASALSLAKAKLSTSMTTDDFAQETAERIARLHGFLISEQVTQQTPVSMGEPVVTADDNVAPGLTLNQEPPIPDFNAFMSQEPFNPFSQTLFDFDIIDFWNTGNYAQT